MNRYGKRCVLYPRVSTEMQVDGYSLEGQKNMLTRFADREEMIVVDTYEDAGKSGKSIEGRPAFQKMLRDIEDGLDIDYILVYKLSRFGRNAADILNSLELVQSYGVNLICIEEGIDSSQTSGKLLISVLSAVAEIERENIIEQTMNGRREKARQGGWNGGFAPYGYTLEDNKLMIEETEAVAIRKIFELYTSSEIGLGGIANQLNLQGIRKIPRQNGTLEDWTGHFIKLILDNPVYCGKIAYGRRTKEKVKGTKNDYQMKRNDDYILTEGQHKGIVSEEVWEKAHAKRLRTGVKQPSKIGRDRVHLLSGLLKCPVCGSPMYTNKHAWTNKDGTYKEIYYYVCSRNRMVRGKHCEYKAMLKKTDIEPMVIEAIREIVRNEEYAQAIKKRIGVQIDTKAVDKELEGYQAKLKEVDLNKTRLEREIDSLPADAKYRERKLHDMTLRLDSLYDVIVELEEKIEDARLRRDAIKQQAITLENIYKIMVNFDCVYNIINDEEKRNVVTALIKEIEIYRNDESEYPLKRIGLNFPVFKDGGEVTELLWDKGNTVETMFDLYSREYNHAAFLLDENLGAYADEILAACEGGKDVGAYDAQAPIVFSDYSTVEEIFPNLYPSMDSAINLLLYTDKGNTDVMVTAEIAGFTQKYEQKVTLTPEMTYLMIKPPVLADMPDLSTTKDTQMTLRVENTITGEAIIQETKNIELHSVYDYKNYSDEFGIIQNDNILAWMTPETDGILQVRRNAVSWLEQSFGTEYGMLPGYQPAYGFTSDQGAYITYYQVAAIQSAISNMGVRYNMGPYSFSASQRVLMPDAVLENGSGICIETAVLMASVLESASMHAMIVFTPGHAQTAVETWSGSGQYFLIETTMLPFTATQDALQSLIQPLSAEEWANYLYNKEQEAQQSGGMVYVVDCDLAPVLNIQGLNY